MYEELHKFFSPVLSERIVVSNIVFKNEGCSFSLFDEKFNNFILNEPLEYCLSLRTFGEILQSYCLGKGLFTTGGMLKRVFKAGVENRNFKTSNLFHPINNFCSVSYGKYPNLPLIFKVPAVKRDCSDIFTSQFMEESTGSLTNNLNFYEYLRIYRCIPYLSTRILREGTIGKMSIESAVEEYAAVLHRRHFYKIDKSPANILAHNIIEHSEKFKSQASGVYSTDEYYFTLI